MLSERKVRILIVDDDPSIVKMLGRFVGDLLFEAVPVVTPHEALDLAARQEFHIAVIDRHLPEMEGVELMKLLREINDEMEVILITGDYCAESAAQAIDSGAYDYLSKPIDLRHLTHDLNAIREQVLHRIKR